MIRHVEHLGIVELRDWADVTNVNCGSGGGKGNPEAKASVYVGVMVGTYWDNGMSFHIASRGRLSVRGGGC